jgi:hypothetical protein
MRSMRSDSMISSCLAAVLAVAATAAGAALPAPPFNGAVVEDVTQTYLFDRNWTRDNDIGPHVDEDAYRGTVRAIVIKAPDDTFDFYFHIARSAGTLGDFDLRWQVPASYTVAYHVTDPELLFVPSPQLAGPAPGTSFTDTIFVRATWVEDGLSPGSLAEGWLGLDTDARAYVENATYVLGDSLDRLQGSYLAQSREFTTFGPAIPEAETYALMLAGLGLLGLRRRWGRRAAGVNLHGDLSGHLPADRRAAHPRAQHLCPDACRLGRRGRRCQQTAQGR